MLSLDALPFLLDGMAKPGTSTGTSTGTSPSVSAAVQQTVDAKSEEKLQDDQAGHAAEAFGAEAFGASLSDAAVLAVSEDAFAAACASMCT